MTDVAASDAARLDTHQVAQSSRASMLVVWNPGAGSGGLSSGGPDRAAIERVLQAHGLDAELFESPSEEDTTRRVESALADGVETIVAAGGDGTVRSIAFQLLGHDAALGILPLGTAMNVARTLDIPLDLEGATAVLAAGHTREIDVGEARGRPFLEAAWVGAGAMVLGGAEEARAGRLGRALEILRWAVKHQRTRVRLQLDGREVRGRAPSIAVANGRFTGRGMELVPQGRLDDGRFDILFYEGFGPLRLAAYLVGVLLGRSYDQRIRRYRAATVRISAHRSLTVRLDSHDIGTTPIELTTRRAALKVVSPEAGKAT